MVQCRSWWRENKPRVALFSTFCRACVVANDKLFVIGGQEGDFMPKPGSPIFKCVRRHEVCMWFLVTLIRAPMVYFLPAKSWKSEIAKYYSFRNVYNRQNICTTTKDKRYECLTTRYQLIPQNRHDLMVTTCKWHKFTLNTYEVHHVVWVLQFATRSPVPCHPWQQGSNAPIQVHDGPLCLHPSHGAAHAKAE